MIKEGAIPIWAKLLLNKMIVWKLNSYWDKSYWDEKDKN